jgi:hypothetical protein
MKSSQLVMLAAVVVVAGCAQSSVPGSSPQSAADAQCQYFVREEGLVYVQTNKVEAVADGFNVEMRLQDSLGRAFIATCARVGAKSSWAGPLPSNAIRRWEGRDYISPNRATPTAPAR